MVIGGNIHAGSIFNNGRSGKAEVGRTHCELIVGAAQETCNRSAEAVGIVKDEIKPPCPHIAANGNGYAGHLDNSVRSFLNTYPCRAVGVND